jgi:hypothetical protein
MFLGGPLPICVSGVRSQASKLSTSKTSLLSAKDNGNGFVAGIYLVDASYITSLWPSLDMLNYKSPSKMTWILLKH